MQTEFESSEAALNVGFAIPMFYIGGDDRPFLTSSGVVAVETSLAESLRVFDIKIKGYVLPCVLQKELSEV